MTSRNNQLVVYQSKSGGIEIRMDAKSHNVWANQAQISELFGVDQSVVSRHINNIIKDREIKRRSNMQKMHNTTLSKPVFYYSLDLILAVGYRTNSRVAIDFRRWATQTLKEYIIEGYAINKRVIANNYQHFLETVNSIKLLLPAKELIDTKDVVDLIGAYADTWVSLEAYDKNQLKTKQATRKSVEITTQKLEKELAALKSALTTKGTATSLFGSEITSGRLAGIVGNVMQSFGGEDLYPTIEEKSANLLYFMVKDHPFMDGNKRSAAFAFIWFLKQTGLLNTDRLTPSALTALTILISESDPKDKEKMVNLVGSLI